MRIESGDILVEKRGALGLVTLNRPQALNALNDPMVDGLQAALEAFLADDEVKHVAIRGVGGKAFCAGGDIRLMHDLGRAGKQAVALDFWAREYRLNAYIHAYPKPYIALLDGIVMGGGVGVSLHGRYRFAGPNYMFAMPEVGIGFFPDVGATWFLPRLAGKTGTYLGLTGARAKAGDAVALGLAEAHVSRAKIPDFVAALEAGEDVEAAVARFRSAAAPGPIVQNRAAIDAAFSGDSVGDILARLAADGSDFAKEAAKAMGQKAPLSLAVALRQMQAGAGLSFEEAMRTEFRIVSRICRGPNFYEGVRATIIDKDQQPAWKPARVEDVTQAAVDAIFAPLGAEELDLSGVVETSA